MSHALSATLSRRSFSAGLALGLPAALLGSFAATRIAMHPLDPAGTGLDLESVFLRLSPFDLRDILMSTPLDATGELFQPRRWADIGRSPYFSSVGGVTIARSESSVLGAYGIYMAPAGARAGQYLGRRALEAMTTGTTEIEVGGFWAEVLAYNDGAARELTQVPVGNVMVLGYDATASGETGDDEHPSAANAALLVAHLQRTFEATSR